MNSMPALPPAQENAAMRHYRKWPFLGAYLWPNPPADNTPNSRVRFWNGAGAALSNYSTSNAEVDSMKDFFQKRLAWTDDQNFTSAKVIFRPPVLSNNGGSVPGGTQLSIDPYTGTAPATYTYATGTIYYTTDGTDPRLHGGAVSGTALTYNGPVTISEPATVNTRLLNGTTWSPLGTAQFTVDTVPASATNIVVSELMYHPAGPTAAEAAAGFGENSFEFVELLNIGTQSVDLTGCALEDAVSFDFATTGPANRTLAPGGRLVIVGTSAGFALRYGNDASQKIAGAFSGSLSNSGEVFTLRAMDGSTIAQFTWSDGDGWPVGADGGGYSLVLNNPAANPNYGSGESWRTSAQSGGTPGGLNGVLFTGSMTADTDGDGLLDFHEFAMGSDLAKPDTTASPVADWLEDATAAGGAYLRFRYQRNLAAEGPHYSVELSTELRTWSSAPAAVTYLGSVNNGDGTATVSVRATQPIGAG